MAPNLTTIEDAFKSYAEAYKKLNDLQDASRLLPGGDQKTGVVGEYYALLYALGNFPTAKIALAPNGQKAYDIEVKDGGESTKIQVKTISCFSKTGKISPIKKSDWSHLYILHLDRGFKPDGFWIIKYADLKMEADWKEIYGPRPDKDRKSSKINFGPNLLDDFLKGIEKGRERLATSKEACIEELLSSKQPPIKRASASKREMI